MADNRIQDASWDVVNSIRDTNQAFASRMVDVLDRNVKFAHSIFLNGLEVLESQTENTRNFTQEWSQQVQKQQDAFQRMAYAWMDIYMNFLHVPLSFYRQMLETTEGTIERGLGYTQEVARRTAEAAESAARQAQQAAQKQGE